MEEGGGIYWLRDVRERQVYEIVGGWCVDYPCFHFHCEARGTGIDGSGREDEAMR